MKFIVINILLLSFVVEAAYQTNCYKFENLNIQNSEEHPKMRSEVWCYNTQSDSGIFIYNSDSSVIKPELSMFIDQQGMMTHASLNAGKISVHKVQARDFNPFDVPFIEPKYLKSLSPSKKIESTSEKKAILYLKNNSPNEYAKFSLQSNQNSFASASYLPWRGYWWPRKGLPIVTSLSKYDKYVLAHSGVDPGSATWERTNHAYHGVSWSGHCNGWAASAILRGEPKTLRTDNLTGITFSVADQKGLLAEADYCVSAAFFGNRNRGSGNNGDIRPEIFHKTLLYYIGEMKKPLAMDYKSNASVDNHIISGYTMQMTQMAPQSFSVIAILDVHRYDITRIETPGNAPIYKKTYKYNLKTDTNGNLIGGSWISDNPDIMWAPLSTSHCQKIEESWVNQILNM